MSVYKREDSPFWWYDFWVERRRYRKPTAVEKTEPRRKAKLAARKARQAIIEQNENGASREISINDAFTRYQQEVANHQPSGDNTLRVLQAMARHFDKTALLSEPIDSELARWVARRRAHTVRGTGRLVSNATVNRDVELLRRVWRRAETVWRFKVAMPNWKAHKLPEPVERVRELSAGEEVALFEAIRPDYLPLIEFALISGIRLGNLIRLTWKNIKDGYVVLRVKSRRPGGKIQRLPVTRAMAVLLARQKGNGTLYVFTYVCKRNRGKQRLKGVRYPFSANGWRKAWAGALATAGIEDLRFHDLRHTAATRVMRKTGNLKLVGKMLGHSDIASTMRYAHVSDDDLKSAMEATFGHRIPHSHTADQSAKPRKTGGK